MKTIKNYNNLLKREGNVKLCLIDMIRNEDKFNLMFNKANIRGSYIH